jgi:hypothetical protein
LSAGSAAINSLVIRCYRDRRGASAASMIAAASIP